MEKPCRLCGVPKPLSEFNNDCRSKDGKQARCRSCDQTRAKNNYYAKYRDTQIAGNKKRYEQRKKWLEDLKKTMKCQTCGDKRHYVLEFHHREPENKVVEVSIMLFKRKNSLKRVLEEIEKCDVLCANCHREKHYLESLD